jgi:RHS repeat-associated protein
MNAYQHETFTVTHHVAEYHYTLYYYDQAGNLFKTVPPAGVQQITDTSWLNQVAAARVAGTSLTPHHTLVTNYRYNTLNQVIAQRTPDGGGSQFWYDRLGRLAVSQNARQNPNTQYSFTQYDTIGRIIQVGQLVSSTAVSNDISRSQNSLAQWLTNALSTADQITVTTYDVPNSLISNEVAQTNTRNRVSWTSLYNTASDVANGSPNAIASSYYSYDILGNVDTLVQDYGNGSLYSDVANIMNSSNRFKKIVYDFDLVSGKVNQVSYQHGYADAFYHSYLYDAENRITNVQSSTDSVNWDNDAFYGYYKHGPLARAVLGQQQVQGLNYAYTLQGWLKAINPDPYTGSGFTLQPDSAGNVVANNAYNLLLNYYNGDYAPISNVPGPDNGVSTALGADSLPLFNGNISSMGINIKKLNAPLLYSYQYDQLNRLTHMDAWKRTSTAWSALTASTDYQENVTYDPNGNILTYHRNRETVSSSNQMDQLQYNYISGTNQLDHIYDTVSGVSNANDIATQSTGNYKYDSIGELVGDAASNITGITWTVYGKIASITKSTDTVIKYTYDPSGNRISKRVVHGSDSTVTWYVRDAQGNILSVYTYGDPTVNGGALAQTELDIYGSSRLGTWKRVVPVSNLDSTIHNPFPNSGDSITFTRGNKLFELTNHLGNVLATISDKRYGVSADDSTVVYYNPEVVGANDYYPFGMQQYARTFTEPNVGNYRFGFNGKENDNEVKGVGDQQDYGMRVYDPRVGRFLSVDPLTSKYSDLTDYQFASNSPVANVDLDGKESKYYELILWSDYRKNGTLMKEGSTQVENKSMESGFFANAWAQITGRTSKTGTAFHITQQADKIDKDGNIVHTVEDLGVLYIPGKDDKKRGGLYLTSPSGGYSHPTGDLSDDDAKPIPIDLLVGAAGGFSDGGGEIDETAELIKKLQEGGINKERFAKVVETVKTLIETEKTGDEKIREPIEKILEALKGEKKEETQKEKNVKAGSVYCRTCERNFEPSKQDSTIRNGTETNKPAKDTVEVHTEN